MIENKRMAIYIKTGSTDDSFEMEYSDQEPRHILDCDKVENIHATSKVYF